MTQADDFTKDPDIARINRFLAGEPRIAEREEWRIDAMWSALERRVGEEGGSVAAGNKGIGKSGTGYSGKTLSRWVGYTAVTTACGILVFGLWNVWPTQSQGDSYKTYATALGQRASITLGDGSQVTLAPATTLRISSPGKSDQAINVQLSGEALFRVNHATARPFVVTASGVTTRVLGTEFTVNAYESSAVKVAVREGRVAVQPQRLSNTNVVIVTAGEIAAATQNTLPVVSPISDLESEFAWAGGNLVLRDVILGEAVVRFARWYGMDFRIADSKLLNIKVNGAFPSAFSYADIKNLADAIGVNVTRDGNIITFADK